MMYSLPRMPLLITSLLMGGCSTKTVDVEQTAERGGLGYETNSETPFTGIN